MAITLWGGNLFQKPEPKQRKTPLSIASIMHRMNCSAMMDGRDPPMIETDLESAKVIQEALADSVGCYLHEIRPRYEDIRHGQFFTVCQYDGVKIVVRRVDPCKLPVDEWREHFGPLADIWS